MKKFAADYGKPVARLLGYRSLTNAFSRVTPNRSQLRRCGLLRMFAAEVRGLLRCCRA